MMKNVNGKSEKAVKNVRLLTRDGFCDILFKSERLMH